MMIYSHYPKAAGTGFDVRNGPNRLRESPWEWRYQRMKADGSFVDRFHVGPSGPLVTAMGKEPSV